MIYGITYHQCIPEFFDAEMKLLVQHGLKFFDANDLYLILSGKVPFPKELGVFISFDDLPQNHHLATKWIKKVDCRFTTYVYSGEYTGTDRPTARWDILTTMVEDGWIVGAHTHNHVDPRIADEKKIINNLSKNVTVLQRRLGVPIKHYACPFGVWTRSQQKAARLLGIKTMRTCVSDPIRPGASAMRIPSYSRRENSQPNEILNWVFRGVTLP